MTFTNRSDNEDNVHVVDYAINRGLYIISNDRFIDLVQRQIDVMSAIQLHDYMDLYLFCFD